MAEQKPNEGGSGRVVRILRSGLAHVDAGELVVRPAPGSEARVERVAEDEATVIQYYFPVEIEVRAAPDPVDPVEIADLTLARLAQAMNT